MTIEEQNEADLLFSHRLPCLWVFLWLYEKSNKPNNLLNYNHHKSIIMIFVRIISLKYGYRAKNLTKQTYCQSEKIGLLVFFSPFVCIWSRYQK